MNARLVTVRAPTKFTGPSPRRSCPFYNGRESEHWAAAEKMKEDIAKLEKKAYLRWQEAGN